MSKPKTGRWLALYKVEVYDEGCPHCGLSKTWCVVDWTGTASGTTYSQEVDAEEAAGEMNHVADEAIAEYIKRNK